jgi:alpha,alpha-trehalase
MLYSLRNYGAAIFDLDGVLTRTQSVHALAWKKLFDQYLLFAGSHQQPFSIEKEYRELIDGKTRSEGIKSFLNSRKLNLPEGKEDDPAGYHSITALSKRKNEFFLEILKQKGIETYQDAVEFLHLLEKNDFVLALTSSSKNAVHILKQTGLLPSFSAVLTGHDLEDSHLRGKPQPDMFLEASRRISVEPKKTIVIEDSLSGIEAAVKGGYGLVIAMARGGDKQTLLNQGALIAEESFYDIREKNYFVDYKNRPPALLVPESLSIKLKETRPILFLDYDGTLTPIVSRPEEAILSDGVRQLIGDLSRHLPLAIVSGRDLTSIRRLVGLGGVYYSGSHGFEISGPKGISMQHPEAISHLDELRALGERLKDLLAEISGSQVEQKSFGIGCHYRNVSKEDTSTFFKIVQSELKKFPNLSIKKGKKVLDIQPGVPWDKGRAVFWLLENIQSTSNNSFPIYIGDDLTDEDAFWALKGIGATIHVGPANSITVADYYLKNTLEVEDFLKKLLAYFAKGFPDD